MRFARFAMPRVSPSPLALSIAALSLGLVAGQAAAAEWFVSNTGNDSTGNGSLASPYKTIKRGISAARSGDIITVRGPAGNNTYIECEVRLRVPLTLRSYTGERAHISCPVTTADSSTVVIDPAASGSKVSNLEISGGQYYGVMMRTNWEQTGPASATGASDIVLEDLVIHDTGRDGIKITPKSNRVTVRRVEIYNTGVGYPAGTSNENKNADGIDNVNGSGMLVEDSYIHDTATTGLYFKGGAADVVIQRNRIENTGDAGILIGFDTSPEFFDLAINPQYYEAVRGIVRNNVVRNTGYAGIGLYASRDSIVANNTIINAAQKGHAAIYFGVTFQDWDERAGRPANINPRLVNNLVLQGSGRCVDIRYSSELGGLSGLSGSINSDWNGYLNTGCTFRDGRPGSAISSGGTLAQWRTAMNADGNSKLAAYTVTATGRLPANSPAINAGTTVAQVSDDIDKQARVVPYDLGADEYQGGTSTVTVRRTGSQPLVAGAAVTASSLPTTAASVPVAVASSTTAAASNTADTVAATPAATSSSNVRVTAPLTLAWLRLKVWANHLRTQLLD